MLVNLLAKRNFFVQIFLIFLFFVLGVINFNSFYLSKLELIGVALSILTIGYVNYIDSKKSIISTSVYTTWFYMLWIMPCMVLLTDFRISGSLLLITYISVKLFYFEVDNTDKYEAFDIGAFLGFAVLLNPPLFILGLIILGYFLSLRAIDSSILVLSILGLLVPILVFVQVSYLLDFDFLINYYRESLMLDYFRLDIKQAFLIPVVIFIVLAFLNYVKNVNKEPVYIKRIFLLLFLMILALIVTSALFGGPQILYLPFFGFPFMILFSKYFSNKKPQLNWLKETILWGYLICMLFYNFYDRIPRIYSLITDVSF